MCGIIGIVGNSDVASALYDGLTVLQHRGQDAAGIATSNGRQLRGEKGNGLVSDVFDAGMMSQLQGHIGIAHCRYPTAGSFSDSAESQPFYVNSPFDISTGIFLFLYSKTTTKATKRDKRNALKYETRG